MNLDRVVLVWLADGSVGSGYLISPSLVLAAKHVMVEAAETQVWLSGSGRYHDAKLVWQSDDELDASLLRLNPPLAESWGPAPRAGRFGRHRCAEWECAGFPDAEKGELQGAGIPDAVSGRGVITRGDGTGARLLELNPEIWSRIPETWPGLKGAAVFSEGCLVGLVRGLAKRAADHRWEATPIERILKACPNKFAELAGFRLASLPAVPSSGLSPRIYPFKAGLDSHPASLLMPEHRIIPFQESLRERENQELDSWCQGSSPLGIRLFHGAAGTGKTRLLIEYCAKMRRQDWSAGFWDASTGGEVCLEGIAETGRPALIVIDGADWIDDLPSRLARLAESANALGVVLLRIVLLARQAGAFWRQLINQSGSTVRAGLAGNNPVELAPIELAKGQRRGILEHARKHFAPYLSSLKTPLPAALGLEAEPFSRIFFLHAAALASLAGEPLAANTLLDGICRREEAFWRAPLSGLPGFLGDCSLEQVRLLLGVITLLQGVTKEEAEQLQQLLAPELDPQLLRLLHSWWPGRQGSGATDLYLAPLAPALVGEAMVLRSLKGSGDAVFWDSLTGVSEAQWKKALGALGRIAQTAEELGQPTGALAATQEATSLYRRLSKVSPDTYQPYLALSLNNLGTRLSELGRAEEALAATQEAVVLRRQLSRASPATVLPQLAGTLNSLASRLSAVGRREEALTAIQEAVKIRRRLVKARPEVVLPELASSLNQLGIRLSELGRGEEALAATREAVDLRRRLSELRPEAYLPDLATSLNNLGTLLSVLGNTEEALAATQEAVCHRRQLSATHGEAFQSCLALSLNNLGNRLSALGRREEAVAATTEALSYYLELAQLGPAAFCHYLKIAVHNLTAQLGEVAQANKDQQRLLAEANRLLRAQSAQSE